MSKTLTLSIIAGLIVGIGLIATFTILPKLFADLSFSAAEQQDQRLIESTKDLPEVKEFLGFYHDAKAEVIDIRSGTIAEGSSKEEVVKYSYEKKYYDRNFIRTASLYIIIVDYLERQGKDRDNSFSIGGSSSYNSLRHSSSNSSNSGAAGLSYHVRMDYGATGFDFESNLEGSSMSTHSDYGNVTKFVMDSGCAMENRSEQ